MNKIKSNNIKRHKNQSSIQKAIIFIVQHFQSITYSDLLRNEPAIFHFSRLILLCFLTSFSVHPIVPYCCQVPTYHCYNCECEHQDVVFKGIVWNYHAVILLGSVDQETSFHKIDYLCEGIDSDPDP